MANDYWDESTDLYLEILREAQKVEDRKLARLIARRLRELSQVSPASTDCCEIILFPGGYTPGATPAPAPIQEAVQFWPRFGFRHLLWFFSVYASLLFGGLMI